MIDVGVALTWIAISAAGAKWLSALARMTASGRANAELASIGGEEPLAHEDIYALEPASRFAEVTL